MSKIKTHRILKALPDRSTSDLLLIRNAIDTCLAAREEPLDNPLSLHLTERSIRKDERAKCNALFNKELQEQIIPMYQALMGVESRLNAIVHLAAVKTAPTTYKNLLKGYDGLLMGEFTEFIGCAYETGSWHEDNPEFQYFRQMVRDYAEGVIRLTRGKDKGEYLLNAAVRYGSEDLQQSVKEVWAHLKKSHRQEGTSPESLYIVQTGEQLEKTCHTYDDVVDAMITHLEGIPIPTTVEKNVLIRLRNWKPDRRGKNYADVKYNNPSIAEGFPQKGVCLTSVPYAAN